MISVTKVSPPRPLQQYHFFQVRDDQRDISGYGFDLNEEVAQAKAVSEFCEKLISRRARSSLLQIASRTGAIEGEVSYHTELGLFSSLKVRTLTGLVSGTPYRLPVFGELKERREWVQIVPTSTSGYAAHPDRNVALQNGLLEILERDAFFLTWYGNIASKVIGHEKLPSTISQVVDELPTQLRLYELPVRCRDIYAVAAIMVRKDKNGYMIGLGASKDCSAAIEKAASEVFFFYSWYHTFAQSYFHNSYNLHFYNGYFSNLDFFWNRGCYSFMQMETGNVWPDQFTNKNSRPQEMEVFSEDLGEHEIMGRTVSVIGVHVSGLIPQHTIAPYALNIGPAISEFPDYQQTWPFFGVHPFT
ncbi:YcaO-like family protein [Rhizobium sp. C4]|uniref:YcaO-like family protein n=1 Tax=Rhizobium sp. C4 TaxID=1349800 RepID=UPI001E3B27C0|nr:YcaO-like family protein [Rhizobium sp. C4]MCD2175098.1 YcaO-like family protein [Rhizobium sp. C4]